MSTDSRRRLGAITALVLGLFVGLTLLPIAITGPVGRSIGHGLWQILGAGALGIPSKERLGQWLISPCTSRENCRQEQSRNKNKYFRTSHVEPLSLIGLR